jgi:putative ABC transport system permease protein
MLADFGDDIGLSLSRTPVRNALAGAGAFLAVAIFVFSAAVTTTAANEVASSFDRLAATSVQLLSAQPDAAPIVARDFDKERLARLPGAVDVGLRWRLGEISMEPSDTPWVQENRPVVVSAVDEGASDFLGLSIDGRGFTKADYRLARPTVLIGVGAARQFDTRLGPGMAIRLDGRRFLVAGILSDAERDAGTLLEVLVPSSTALRFWPSRQASATIVIDVEVGSAATIAEEAPLALDPNHPERFVALFDAEATQLRRVISAQVDGAAILVGIGLLITGAFGIAGAMVASVSERRHELGIRRALGARRSQIVRLIIGEATLTGAVASLAGLTIGLAAFLVVAIEREWSPVLLPETVIAAPAAGVLAGLIAGLIPSVYASRIEPAEALRS